MTNPHIESFALGGFLTNCFVVSVPDAVENACDCWIVDCGFEPQEMFDHIDAKGLRPTRLLLTHAHADHMAGVDEALSRYGEIAVCLHEAEKGFCSDPMLNLSGMMGMNVATAEPTEWLSDGDRLELSGTTWRVIHAPGHSPGCALYVHDESKQAMVGDTLFADSIGRIDFPTSNPAAMRHTIKEVIMKLPDEMVIHPGHMNSTTIGRERTTNPYVLHEF